jgi:hypothetical protein
MTEKREIQDALNEHWHLDKKVPLALIMTMFIQTAGIMWWAATTTERLSAVERRIEMSAPQGDRLTRVEVRLDNIVEGLGEIKNLIRRQPN